MPRSEGGITPVAVGCRGGAIMWILILMLVSGGARTVMELMCDGLMVAAAGSVSAVIVIPFLPVHCTSYKDGLKQRKLLGKGFNSLEISTLRCKRCKKMV